MHAATGNMLIALSILHDFNLTAIVLNAFSIQSPYSFEFKSKDEMNMFLLHQYS